MSAHRAVVATVQQLVDARTPEKSRVYQIPNAEASVMVGHNLSISSMNMGLLASVERHFTRQYGPGTYTPLDTGGQRLVFPLP
jgi:hypothetical protein